MLYTVKYLRLFTSCVETGTILERYPYGWCGAVTQQDTNIFCVASRSNKSFLIRNFIRVSKKKDLPDILSDRCELPPLSFA